ncbi:SDR family oxidoreductase [Actinomadura madurae]|uniref:SDR family oxidoreductase n=1 Tax=Actinomadura madurae TaxID=1993 RepID=UPI0020D23892|nr:NmrA family transcriptional regulator [Actinomadura madurae]MCQ0016521.1 NmrA family transcriptional regulator [Actinomadura madurae]
MRIAVAGATGNIGALTVAALQRDGHEVVRISRSLGVDLITGEGLGDALAGVEAVVDATNSTAADPAETVAYFGAVTRNLLAAEERAGVGHHVVLSIAGVDRIEGNAHYARQARAGAPGGRRSGALDDRPGHAVPRLRRDGGELDRAGRRRHDRAPAGAAGRARGRGRRPRRDRDGPPRGRCSDVAGPEPQDLVDMARRTNQVLGRTVKLVPTWSAIFSAEAAGDVLLPGPDARIMPTTFDQWLAEQR